jgi:hypothetical protein
MPRPIGLFQLSGEAARLAVVTPWVIPLGLLLFVGILMIARRTGKRGG